MAYPGGPGYPGAPPAGYQGVPPQQYGQQPAYGYGVRPQAYGAPPQPQGYGAPPQGYGAPPQGYGAPPGQMPGQQPQVDPTLQSWFAAVDQDRSGKITAHELRQALVNGNWSHFNEESCRLMINMFDRDFSGTIDLYEFQALWQYIQQWKQTFERFDANRSGQIEGYELQQAFQSMGYNVSPQFVQTVVVKYDVMGRRSLTLDSFIQASVLLKSLTDAFKQRDNTMSGFVRMNYEDFMQLAVTNRP